MGVLTGTAVSIGGKGLLIRGASGRGKSALALDLISRGAALISDDKVHCKDGMLSPPPAIAGLIEARGIGILELPYCAAIPLTAVVDLDAPKPERLPLANSCLIEGQTFPLIAVAAPRDAAAALYLMLLHGRHA